ncbi:MAG: hypothetical protein LBT70_03435 [Holosporaceae bacterium]|nr:hypothetical protein [Holosporaceae bacterium]
MATEKFRTIIVELKKIDLSKAKADNMFYVWSYFLIAPQEIPEEFWEIAGNKKLQSFPRWWIIPDFR